MAPAVAGICGVLIWTVIFVVCFVDFAQSVKTKKIDLRGKSEITRSETPFVYWGVLLMKLVTLLISFGALVAVTIAAIKGNVEWITPREGPSPHTSPLL